MDQQQLIEANIMAARSRLTTRLDQLERKVVGTASDSVDTVRQATADVGAIIKETTTGVSAALNTATSTVCETFDVARQVRTHPWPSLGLAAAAGILVGLMPRRTRSHAAAADQPGVFTTLWDSAKRELMGLGESLLESGAAKVKQSLTDPLSRDEPLIGSERPTDNADYHDGVGCCNGRRF